MSRYLLFSALVLGASALWFAQILLDIFSPELCIIEKQKYVQRPSIPAFFSLGTEFCLAGSA
jgi:hypothetical protein